MQFVKKASKSVPFPTVIKDPFQELHPLEDARLYWPAGRSEAPNGRTFPDTPSRAGHSRKHVPLQLGYSRRSYSWSNKEFNSSSLNAVIDAAWSSLPKCIDEGLDIQIRIHTQDEMLNSC